MKFSTITFLGLCLVATLTACGDDHGHDHDHHGHDHENEVMTTVNLTFSPASGGDNLVFTWRDADGTANPVIDDITLAEGETYTLDIQILNELEDPAEDVTAELQDELDEHQFFITGSAVSGPASDSDMALMTHAYADVDGSGNPVGLANTIETIAAGTGGLKISLRHMPPVNDMPVKTADLADLVKAGDLSSLPGNFDIQVEFNVTVQ
ncbi:MAG: hypothetical protein ACPGQS_02735 [Bradymonadia bacterium]